MKLLLDDRVLQTDLVLADRTIPDTSPVCTENPIRVDDLTESPKLAE